MAGTGAQAAAEKSAQLSRQAATRHADSIGSAGWILCNPERRPINRDWVGNGLTVFASLP
jgi:hypothetical protein